MEAEALKYTDTHMWVRLDRSGDELIATVGVTEFALAQLKDLVYLRLPKVGEQVSAGREFGEIESVKAASALFSPVSGEVVAVNPALAEDLDLIARDPYGAGWLIQVKVTDLASLEGLLDEAAYRKRCGGE